MLEDIQLNLDIQKKIWLLFACTYNAYVNQDTPGFLPMMLFGNIIYQDLLSDKALKKRYGDLHDNCEHFARAEFVLLNSLIALTSFGLSLSQNDRSYLGNLFGVLCGEFITHMKELVTSKKNKM